MRIAIATCAAFPDGRPDDRQLAALTGAEIRVWNEDGIDWSAYDRVVIRSVWDYHHDLGKFLAWCDAVGSVRLRNPPELVAFNADKRYLATLRAPTVPTTFLGPGTELAPYGAEIVVKPNVSAGARDTGRFEPDAFAEAAALVELIHASGRTALVQPYLPAVDTQGETAVVLFAGAVSHVLAKRPVLVTPGVAPLAQLPGSHAPAAVMLDPDLVTAGVPTDAHLDLARAAHAEIAARFGTPLYARVDMVPGPDGEPVVIELELIEPNLYLDLASGSAGRLATAIQTTM